MKTTDSSNDLKDTAGTNGSVRVEGDRGLTVPTSVVQARQTIGGIEERTVEFRCLSGRLIRGTWRGLPLRNVIRQAAVPDETTHLVFEAVDGHTACVEVAATTSAFLALTAVNGPGDGDALPRVVGPELDGPRAVKRVARIEPKRIAPEVDPREYDSFDLEAMMEQVQSEGT